MIRRRQKYIPTTPDLNQLIDTVARFIEEKHYLQAIDVCEFIADYYESYSVDILEQLYDIYQGIGAEDRYNLYQARHYNFDIKPGNKVLDIGSGHLPFPFATHLAEFALEDDAYGRSGHAFKSVQGLPVTQCSVEDMPFTDKEFDFVYCSHVLEHVENPEKACAELIRVAQKGYIEAPSRSKDLWLNTAKSSNHRWKVEKDGEKLIFREYSDTELEGIRNNILMDMHCKPETSREKAFSALVLLKSDVLNTMFMWEDSFELEVHRR